MTTYQNGVRPLCPSGSVFLECTNRLESASRPQEVHRMSTTGHDGKGGGDEGDSATPGARGAQTMIRVLDPTTARFTTGGAPARPTLYLTDRLLVRNYDVGGGRGL